MGAEVLAISMDDLNGAEMIAQRVGIDFPILYTSNDNSVPKEYGVFNLHNDGLASPSVFIVDKDGVIIWEYISSDPYGRVSAGTVLANLP